MSRIPIPSLADTRADTHATLQDVTRRRRSSRFLLTDFVHNIAPVDLDCPAGVPARRETADLS